MAPTFKLWSLAWFLLLVSLFYQWSMANEDCSTLPQIRQPISLDKTAEKGYSVTFTCILEGDTSDCTLIWHHVKSRFDGVDTIVSVGGDSMRSGYTPEVDPTTDPSSMSLTIDELRQGDTGTVVCQVKKHDCVNSQQFRLVVEYEATINFIGPRMAPYWSVLYPGKLHYNESDTAYLTCNASGEPKPLIIWSRAPSPDNFTTIILKEGTDDDSDVLTATLPNVTRKQSGRYACEAKNNRGQVDIEYVELVVQYAPSVVLNVSNEVRRAPGQDAYLKCDVTATPPPVSIYWMKNSTKLPDASNDPDTNKLVFTMVKPEDYGNYTCVATNDVGTGEATVELHGRPLQPTITNTNSQGTRRHTFPLRWAVPSHPYPIPVTSYVIERQRIEFSMTGEEILIPSVPLTITVPGTTTCERLVDLQPDSQYKTRVCPVNDYGMGDCTPVFTFNSSKEDDQQDGLEECSCDRPEFTTTMPDPTSDCSETEVCVWIPERVYSRGESFLVVSIVTLMMSIILSSVVS